MNDPNKEQPVINFDRTSNPGEPLDRTIPAARRKRRHFVRLMVLISVCAVVVMVCMSRSALVRSYEGVAAALCVVACGVFLVRRLIRLLAEEDKIQEQLLNENQTAASPSQTNPAELQTNPPAPPAQGGQNIK